MPDQMFGPYRLEALLGRGGMGEVWRAFDTGHDRVVAIKLLLESLSSDAEYRARFEREARVAAGLTEQHTIPIHQYGHIDGRLYIDMRYIEGADLGVVLARDGRLAAARAVGIVGQVASALDAAHRAGLVHRDVKPANVLLAATASGDTDSVYLVDFGIARPITSGTDGRLTLTGAAIGTPAYMAPERFAAGTPGIGSVDHRADVYALGCLLFECLTGAKPFTAAEFAAMMFQHLNQPPPRPSTKVPDLPAGFDEVIATALAKRPEQRYGSAGALAAASRRALEPAPPILREPQLPEPHNAGRSRDPSIVTFPRAQPTPEPAPRPSPQPDPTARSTRTGRPASPTVGRFAEAPATMVPPPALMPTARAETLLPPVQPAVPRRAPGARRRGNVLALVTALVLAVGVTITVVVVTNLPGGSWSSPSGADASSAGPTSAGAPARIEVGQPISLPTAAGQEFPPTVSGVAVGQLDGRPVVAVGGGTYGDQPDKVQVFDVATQQPVGQPIGGPSKSLNALAIAQLDGRPVIVGGSQDTTVWVWDLATGRQVGKSFTGDIGIISSVAVAQLGDRPVVVTASGCAGCEPDNPDAIRVWDLATHQPIGQPIAIPGLTTVVVVELDERPVVVAGSYSGEIGVWDLAGRQQIGQPLALPVGELGAFTVGRLDGRAVIIAGSRTPSGGAPGGNTIQVWDLATRQPLGQPITGHPDGVTALTTVQLDGRPVIVSAGVDNTIRLWELRTGEPLGQPVTVPTAAQDQITTLAVAETNGRPVLVTGSFSNAVRIWDLTAITAAK